PRARRPPRPPSSAASAGATAGPYPAPGSAASRSRCYSAPPRPATRSALAPPIAARSCGAGPAPPIPAVPHRSARPTAASALASRPPCPRGERDCPTTDRLQPRCTSGSVAMPVAVRQVGGLVAAAGDRPAGVAAGAAQPMALPGARSALRALAAPRERRRVGVPADHGLGQPGHELVGALGVLAGQGAADQDPLERLGQIQPRAGDRGPER